MNEMGRNSGRTTSRSERPRKSRETRPGMDVTRISFAAHQELHLSLRPVPGEKPSEMVSRLAGVLKDHEATVIRHEIFGPVSACSKTLRALRDELNGVDWPVTWVEGSAPISGGISGMHIFAVTGTHVDTICQEGQPIGRIFCDGQVRHCLLGNLVPPNPSASKSEQCREIFEKMGRSLLEAGMGMANVARTWFSLDDILSWYEEFNNIRTGFFKERKLLKGLLPASTGVGGRNPTGAAIVGGVWAVQTAGSPIAFHAVPSPLQCSSIEYGSAFSRAVLVDTPIGRRLLISGTASIDPDGSSSHAGDLHGQIELSMEIVRGILISRGFDFPDVTRATAYFKNVEDAPAFDIWRTKRGLGSIPLITTQSTICRRELLFEIELDAIALDIPQK
jgi:enamine deaminase RidA (YjgF/YER057c/UK114 family)